MIVSFKIKLNPESSIARAIDVSQKAYTESYNRVIASQYSNERINASEIHKVTYLEERKLSGLPAQLTCSARNRAYDCITDRSRFRH